MAVNQEICALRQVAEEWSGSTPREKKTAVAVHQEITREINLLLSRIFAERHKTGNMDLEAVELGLRGSLHQAGAMALTALLQFDAPGTNAAPEALSLRPYSKLN